jgi:hypothetical protein
MHGLGNYSEICFCCAGLCHSSSLGSGHPDHIAHVGYNSEPRAVEMYMRACIDCKESNCYGKTAASWKVMILCFSK